MVKPSEFERVNEYFDINKKIIKPETDFTKYHYHNCCEVIFPLKGEAVYFNNGQNYSIKPGQILFINSLELHKSISCKGAFERFVMYYRGSYVESMPAVKMPNIFGILDERHFGSRLVDVPLKLYNELTEILTVIYNSDTTKSMFFQVYRFSYFLRFLVNIADRLLSTKSEEIEAEYSNPRIKIIREYIDENLAKSLTLDNIAEHFNISKYYLCRIFKESIGMSIVNYMNHMRMIKAERLINQGKYSITEIANMSGFNSLIHFDRTFKKIIGISPSDYKKSFSLKCNSPDE